MTFMYFGNASIIELNVYWFEKRKKKTLKVSAAQ